VELEALVYKLPTVTVHSVPLCVRRADQAGRVASLWEEASTAHEITRISVRDKLVRARVVNYTRDLHVQTLRVEAERLRRQTEGVVEQPFVSLPADVLSRQGYWRTLPNDSIVYYAPDATVLLSASFARDHCFSLAEGRDERSGLTGMAFEPRAGREVADVKWDHLARRADLRAASRGVPVLAPAVRRGATGTSAAKCSSRSWKAAPGSWSGGSSGCRAMPRIRRCAAAESRASLRSSSIA
jgi:hypothetical protein